MLEFNALLGGKVSVHDMRVAVFFVVLKRHFRFSHIHKKELAKKCFLENHLLLSGGKTVYLRSDVSMLKDVMC